MYYENLQQIKKKRNEFKRFIKGVFNEHLPNEEFHKKICSYKRNLDSGLLYSIFMQTYMDIVRQRCSDRKRLKHTLLNKKTGSHKKPTLTHTKRFMSIKKSTNCHRKIDEIRDGIAEKRQTKPFRQWVHIIPTPMGGQNKR